MQQVNPAFQMPQQVLNSLTTLVVRPTPEFGRTRNWAETQNLTDEEQQNIFRACPHIDQAQVVHPSCLPWLAKAPVEASFLEKQREEMQTPGSQHFLSTQASMAPLERTLNVPLHCVISPLDVDVAHPKFPLCTHIVLAHGYPQKTPTESAQAFERR